MDPTSLTKFIRRDSPVKYVLENFFEIQGQWGGWESLESKGKTQQETRQRDPKPLGKTLRWVNTVHGADQPFLWLAFMAMSSCVPALVTSATISKETSVSGKRGSERRWYLDGRRWRMKEENDNCQSRVKRSFCTQPREKCLEDFGKLTFPKSEGQAVRKMLLGDY